MTALSRNRGRFRIPAHLPRSRRNTGSVKAEQEVGTVPDSRSPAPIPAEPGSVKAEQELGTVPDSCSLPLVRTPDHTTAPRGFPPGRRNVNSRASALLMSLEDLQHGCVQRVIGLQPGDLRHRLLGRQLGQQPLQLHGLGVVG